MVEVQRSGTFNVLVGRVNDVLQDAIGAPLRYLVNWGRLYSLWPVHLETACCSVEFGAAAGSRFDLERFGVLEAFGSLRQCDLLVVMGTVTRKLAPRLKLVYDQMPEPKWVIAMGACASSGGMFNNYTILQGVDRIVPVDIYIPFCPPRPEALMEGIIRLHEAHLAGIPPAYERNGVAT